MASVLFNQNRSINMKMKLSFVALAALLLIGLTPASSLAYIGISVGFAPPAIPIYTQPYAPAGGYLWAPGYWAFNGFDYYWVPGYWALPPRVGFYWTPGYWAYDGGRYFFNDGYWGPTVGFYGGINYGYGYTGVGYWGAEWAGGTLRYNTAVTRVNTAVIKNTYVNKNFATTTTTRASFNGPGGVTAKATAQEQAAAKAEHIAPTAEQRSRVEAAKNDPALRAKDNHGKPKADAVQAFNRSQGTQAGPANAKGANASGNAGNSALEHKQGNPATRTIGSQNNKARSAEARASHATTKPTRFERPAPAATHARSATSIKPSSHAYNPPTNRHVAQRPEITSRRPATATGRQAGPPTTAHGKASTAPTDKKKKGTNEPPGRGY
ncbi:MAG: hypothetical protein DME34_08125 [Verrucomicrobia bacterium]|nr:MAG: hypothetical protein DME34_08125 [Verrucomicrobiota bacterium]